eukprot:COSAG02_NODE_45674_length_355_cov_0.609375_1_plen_53_part_10
MQALEEEDNMPGSAQSGAAGGAAAGDAGGGFFKQKTAYVMESRDWSSDVCSSD